MRAVIATCQPWATNEQVVACVSGKLDAEMSCTFGAGGSLDDDVVLGTTDGTLERGHQAPVLMESKTLQPGFLKGGA